MMWNKLTNHVFYTNNDPETDRPCIGYVKGEKASLLMDAGNSPAHAELLKAGLAEGGLPLPKYVALTHAHWDHTYGLCSWDAVSFAGEKTNAILGEMKKWQWDDASMKGRIESGEDSLSVPEDGLLFLGDSYCSVPVGEDWVYDKELLGKFIAWLEEEDFSIAIKGHHPPQKKAELLAELKADYNAL